MDIKSMFCRHKKLLISVALLSFSGCFKAQAYANVVHLTQCGMLAGSNVTYVLDNDVRSDGTCFVVTGANIELDLNGKTITYDDYGGISGVITGIPNADFETSSGGNDLVPLDWDLSAAPAAKRVSTYDYPMVNRWHLQIDHPQGPQEIISGPVNLPANAWVTLYHLIKNPDWRYTNMQENISVVDDDGVEVFNYTPTTDTFNTGVHNSFTFKTNEKNTHYHVHLIYPSLQDTYKRDSNLKITTNKLETYDIDLVDLRPSDMNGADSGVQTNFSFGVKRYFASTGTLWIHGGTIRQGNGGGYRCHNIYNNGNTGLTVEDMTLIARGVEASNIVNYNASHNFHVRRSVMTNDNPLVFKRGQLTAAVDIQNSSNCSVEDNQISASTGWGDVYLGGANSCLVSGNTLKTKSVTVNHHAIVLINSSNNEIANNTIESDPGQGILLSAGNPSITNFNNVHDNNITIKSTAPNWDDGYYSADGIRLNDYGQDSANDASTSTYAMHDNMVKNNTITIIGKHSPFYTYSTSPNAPTNTLSGICNASNAANNIFEGNVINTIMQDLDVQTVGMQPGSKWSEVVFRNNTITSDQCNLQFGHYPSYEWWSTFVSNVLRKGTAADSSYATLCVRVRDANKPVVSNTPKETHFVDTKLETGTSLLEPIANATNPGYITPFQIFVDWYLNITALNAQGAPLANAPVVITDTHAAQVFSGVTDADGKLKVALNQVKRYATSNNQNLFDYATPHNVSIDGHIEQVAMDGSKNLTYTQGAVFVLAPAETSLPDVLAPSTIVSVDGGTFNSTQSVTLTCVDSNSGCNKTYYTTNGTNPATSSAQYTGPIAITQTTTLKYFSKDVAGNSEQIKTQTYTINKVFALTDFVSLVSNWLKTGVGISSDINTDNVVNAKDLGIMMSEW